ncbi:MAG: YegS/Rv2252/BmrU family lipid kinase [Phycisphaeraceae bacterium]
MADRQSLCLLVNERGGADDRLRPAVQALREAGHRIEVRLLWEPGQGRQFAAEAVRQHTFDAIVAGGGDGTLNEVINGVMAAAPDRPPMVGVLPFGTANDFALAAGMPADDPATALRLLTEIEPRRVDLGQVVGRWFVNAATVGLGAEITADTPKPLKQLLGGAAYSLNALVKLADHTPRAAAITAPDSGDAADLQWQGDLLMLIVANARTAGGGYAIAPGDARLDDGLLDVTLIANAPRRELTEALTNLVTTGRAGHPAVLQRRVPWLELDAEQPLTVNLDGESLHLQHARFSVQPAALPMLIADDTAFRAEREQT